MPPKDALTPNTLDIDQALQQAITHHKAGNLQEAERLYRAILQVQPVHPDANHNLGLLAVAIGKPDAALPFLKAAFDQNPAYGKYWLSYTDVLIRCGNVDRAKEVIAAALEKQEKVGVTEGRQTVDTAHLAGRFNNWAHTLLNQGRTDDAVAFYRQALSIKPDYAQAYNNLGVALKKQGRLDEAIISYRQALLIDSDYADAYNNLGNALKDQGQLAKAVENYRQALLIKPDYADAYNNLGFALQAQGQLDDAIASYRQALVIKPDYADAHNNLGVAFQAQGQLDEAVASYRHALVIKPDYAQAYNNLGVALKKQGRLDEAIISYRQALLIDSDYADAYNNLGNALKDQGQLAKAVESIRRAVSLCPENSVYRNNISSATSAYDKATRGAPAYLEETFYDAANQKTFRRFFPREGNDFIYAIDIVGTCNLCCPTCPVGHSAGSDRPKGFMNVALFKQIIKKIKNDNASENPIIWLYIWGEPLLHPNIVEILDILKENHLTSMISTNLNVRRNLREVIMSGPTWFKISVSGYSQNSYMCTHKGGNIELVKNNMRLIRKYLNEFRNTTTTVFVGHHLYKNNVDEAPLMKKFVESLGFLYDPVYATFHPLEKVVEMIVSGSQAEHKIMDNLLIDPTTAAKINTTIAGRNELDCEIRFNVMAINVDGSVALCCGVYDKVNMLGANFLETSHNRLQEMKYRHPFCKQCYKFGLQYSPLVV